MVLSQTRYLYLAFHIYTPIRLRGLIRRDRSEQRRWMLSCEKRRKWCYGISRVYMRKPTGRARHSTASHGLIHWGLFYIQCRRPSQQGKSVLQWFPCLCYRSSHKQGRQMLHSTRQRSSHGQRLSIVWYCCRTRWLRRSFIKATYGINLSISLVCRKVLLLQRPLRWAPSAARRIKVWNCQNKPNKLIFWKV